MAVNAQFVLCGECYEMHLLLWELCGQRLVSPGVTNAAGAPFQLQLFHHPALELVREWELPLPRCLFLCPEFQESTGVAWVFTGDLCIGMHRCSRHACMMQPCRSGVDANPGMFFL